MRIGIDATTVYTSQPTGLGVYTINMVNHLARIHDDVVVWTVDDSRFDIEESKLRKVMQQFRFLGNDLFQLRPLWVEFVLPHLLRREGVDILYSTIPNGLSQSPVPHVVTVHDLIPLTFPEDAPRTVQWNFRYRLPTILRNATDIIAVSEYTRRDLIKQYPVDETKISTVTEGFDRDHFRPVRDDDRLRSTYGLEYNNYLLYVGNASRRKNLDTVIEIFARISRQYPLKLALIGTMRPHEQTIIRKKLAVYGIQDRVVMPGYAVYQDLPILYSGAALFLFLSHYEGFGLPVLESMACGTPVIASNTTSVPEVAGEAAVLVNPADADGITDTVLSLLDNNGALQALSTAGREQCQKFRWETAASNVLSVLGHRFRRGGVA